MLDAAGAWPGAVPKNHTMQGASVLDLLRGPGSGAPSWRPWLGLEHATCYNASNHWNALTDGVAWKYVFNAQFAREQLFDLAADPYELVDLAGDPAHAATLELWRARLVQQFETEGRGPAWVKGGVLQARPLCRAKGCIYSPNYPGPTVPDHGFGGGPLPPSQP